MELTGYSMDYSALRPIQMTLRCIGTYDDLETVERVYNRELDRAKEEMKAHILGTNNEKENKTMTATELCRIEKEAYGEGYHRGDKDGFNRGVRAAKMWNTKGDFKIKKVIFNDPATIVFWADGTKTVAKAHGDDKFDKEVGLTVCIAKKALGNRSNFDKVFKKWIKD